MSSSARRIRFDKEGTFQFHFLIAEGSFNWLNLENLVSVFVVVFLSLFDLWSDHSGVIVKEDQSVMTLFCNQNSFACPNFDYSSPNYLSWRYIKNNWGSEFRFCPFWWQVVINFELILTYCHNIILLLEVSSYMGTGSSKKSFHSRFSMFAKWP